MAQYIDKDALVAEIERRIGCFKNERNTLVKASDNNLSLGARIAMCEELIVFINTIKVKEVQEEPIDVGTQIYYQNDAIKNLNNTLNSMEHNGHLPKMMTAAESLGISEEEYAKIEDEFFKEQEDPVSEVWHNASKEPNDMSHCLIYYGCKESVGNYLHYESVLYNKKEKVFVTPSFPHPTGYKVEQKSIDGGCVAEVYKNKRDRILISDITQWCYLKDLHNFSNVQRTVKNWKEEPVRGDFEMALAEMIDKAQKCVVEPWVVAAQWKDELLRLAKECKAMQEHPKDCMYSKDNYTDEDRKILCEGCEEDCKYNKKEEPVSEDLEKEFHKVWDRETLDEYAYQVAYDLSNDWMRETPTWDDVETACKLGAGWKEKHMIELGMSVSNKAQKGE